MSDFNSKLQRDCKQKMLLKTDQITLINSHTIDRYMISYNVLVKQIILFASVKFIAL